MVSNNDIKRLVKKWFAAPHQTSQSHPYQCVACRILVDLMEGLEATGRVSVPVGAEPEQREQDNGPTVSMETLSGVTVAGARAYWQLKALERRHEALLAALMTVYSDPHLSWDDARSRIASALSADAADSGK